MLNHLNSGVLDQAYLGHGEPTGWPVVLLHGFPYDPSCWESVTEPLVAAGARVIAPYLRGFGPTRFRSAETPRSGEQAALGFDLLSLLNALELPTALLAGFDWGGRAACVTAALWPERVRGLVTMNGYNIQNIAASVAPDPPAAEHRHWYQYYFHSDRGRAALESNPGAVCELLWQLWSPTWTFTPAQFERAARAFDNPDFVDVVIQSYKHRFGLVDGDPALSPIEARLAAQPRITVPTISLVGLNDGVIGTHGLPRDAAHFSGSYDYRTFPDAGHNLPAERPDDVVRAILDLHARTAATG
jgi:pimeloyl-ACP methyl ester carboxylesterase